MSSSVALPVAPSTLEVSSSCSETEELQLELSLLKEDNTYVDFVEAIVTGKDLSEPDSEDPLYSEGESINEGTEGESNQEEAAPVKEGKEGEGEEEQEEESGFQDNEDDSSDDDSDATLEDIEEDSAPTDAHGAPIPPRMKVEANKRFPPFWKTHMKLQAAEGEGEEGDADYCPPADGDKIREKAESGTDSSDSSDSEDEEDDDMVAEETPIDDTSEVSKALQAGIEEMQLVEEEVKQEQAQKEQEGGILRAISSFDESTYDESADADFAPPADVDAVIEAAEEEDEKILTGEQEEPITDNDSEEVKSEENEEMET